VEEILELAAHLERFFPIIGRPRVVPGEGTDISTLFHAGDVARIGAGIETARPQILVKAGEGAAIFEQSAE
jgi:hypothetical protein